jgi:tetratricopeptide (TPR) repeat protein
MTNLANLYCISIFINQNIVLIFDTMNFLSYKLIILTLAITSCQYSPHSKWRAHNVDDDQLTNQEKIDLFISGSNKLSSSGLAAVAQLYENQLAWNQAMVAIKQAIEEDPMNSSYHSLKADYAYALGQKSVAYREALTAYQLGSKSLQQSLDLAKMAVALSEFSIVNNIIDSLLIAYPDDVDVVYMAARKHDKSNNSDLARKYYAKVNRANPENIDNALFYSRFLLAQNEFEEAKSVLDKAIDHNPSQAICLLQGDVHYRLEQFDSAAFYYQMALVSSIDTTTYNRILDSYSLAGINDSLISIGQSAVQAFPDNKNYLLITARTLDKRYRYDEALPYYLSLYKMDTLDSLVAAELAYLQRKIAYLQRKRLEERN